MMADLFVYPCGCVENHAPSCSRYRLVVDPRDAEIARLKAANAEMRAALEEVLDETSLAFAVAKANRALSRTDLGRGWASPEVVAKVRDAAIKCGDCVLCQGTAERHDDGCPVADLDALLKKAVGDDAD